MTTHEREQTLQFTQDVEKLNKCTGQGIYERLS